VCFVRPQDAMVDDLIELVIQHTGLQVRNTPFLHHFASKTKSLARQARDRHRDSSKKEGRFLAARSRGAQG
jgi:hypothetical protein